MANQLIGRILQIKPTEAIPTSSGNEFLKRELILDCTKFDPITGERGFENTPVIEFTGDRCAVLDQFSVGQIVTVSFDVQGGKSASSDRYFNSVRGYRIELRDAAKAAPAPAPQQPAPMPATAQPVRQPAPTQQAIPGTQVPPKQELPW